MEQKPKNRKHYAFPYFFLGILIAIIVVALLAVLFLVFQGQAVTLENLLKLMTTNLLFLYIDVLAFYSAIIWGLVGYQKDKAEDSRSYSEWVELSKQREVVQAQENQTQLDKKHQVEIARLTEQLANQKTSFQDLEVIIQRGKQQWEATFDAVDDLIVLTDENGSIIRCNRATAEIFQLGYNQVIGRGIDELFANDTVSILGMMPGEKKDMKLPKADVWYQISKNHLLIDGKQEGWVNIFRNITPLKQAYRDQQRLTQYYELLVNNSPVAIVTLNQEDRIIDCNPAFEHLFQFDKREVIGSKVDELIIPQDLAVEANGLTDAVGKGIKVQSITQRGRKDGSLVDVEVYGIPVVLGGKQVGSLGLYHDISNLVRTRVAVPVEQLVEEETVEPEAPVEEPVVEEEPQPELEPAVEQEQPLPEPEPVVEESSPTPSARRRLISVEDIEGIGPVYALKLLEVGIKTTDDLLEHGKSRKGREDLVEQTGISSLLILKWVNMADLMRIKGVGEEYSELLERAGVDTVKELRNRNPKNLHDAMVQYNETHKLVRRLPTLADVESWVKEAQESEPLMSY
jgi:PAS domain S-box-containing protein